MLNPKNSFITKYIGDFRCYTHILPLRKLMFDTSKNLVTHVKPKTNTDEREKYVSGCLFKNKCEVGTKNCNWVSQYI